MKRITLGLLTLISVGSVASSAHAGDLMIAAAMQRCTTNEECTLVTNSCADNCGFVPVNKANMSVLDSQYQTRCGKPMTANPVCNMNPPIKAACVNTRCTIDYSVTQNASPADYKAGAYPVPEAPVADAVPAATHVKDSRGLTAYDLPQTDVKQNTVGTLNTTVYVPPSAPVTGGSYVPVGSAPAAPVPVQAPAPVVATPPVPVDAVPYTSPSAYTPPATIAAPAPYAPYATPAVPALAAPTTVPVPYTPVAPSAYVPPAPVPAYVPATPAYAPPAPMTAQPVMSPAVPATPSMPVPRAPSAAMPMPAPVAETASPYEAPPAIPSPAMAPAPILAPSDLKPAPTFAPPAGTAVPVAPEDPGATPPDAALIRPAPTNPDGSTATTKKSFNGLPQKTSPYATNQ